MFSHTLANHNALTPALNKYGLPYVNTTDNPVAETSRDAGYTRQNYKQINGQLGLQWAIPWVEGLKARGNFNYRYFGTQNKEWRKDAAQYDWDSKIPSAVAKPELSKTLADSYSYTYQAFAEYGKTFASHSVNALAGYEATYGFNNNVWHKRVNYNFPIDQFNPGPKEGMDGGGGESEYGRAGIVAQLKYNYGGKYFLEGSLRHDASDLFPKDRR